MVNNNKPQPANVQRDKASVEEDDDLMVLPKEEEEIERVLADIPLGELQKVRADGSHALRSKAAIKKQQKPGRAHKNRLHKIPEKEKLQKLIKKERCPNVVKELKEHICWIDKQLRSAQQKKVGSHVLSEHIKKEKEATKEGKRPYYLKKSEIRQRELAKKYEDLKAAGKLDTFIEKRRKRNALKDIRYMPYRRTNKNA